MALLLSVSASASLGPVCESCQLPSSSAVGALGLGSQIPGLAELESGSPLGKPFGTIQWGRGLVPTQPALEFPSLWNLSGGSSPPATPSWLERVSPGFLPADFSLAPRPLVDPKSISWNWGGTTPGLGSFNPYLAMTSMWSGPSAPWAQAAAFWSGMGWNPPSSEAPPVATPPVALTVGSAR